MYIFFYSELNKVYETKPRVLQSFPQINFNQTFANVFDKCIDPSTLNVTFKLAHDALPVAYRLHAYGMPIDKNCSLCKKEAETVQHLFYYCTQVHKARQLLTKCFRAIIAKGASPEAIRFSILDETIDQMNRKTVLILLSEYRYVIWHMRNLARFEKKNTNSDQVYSLLINRLKFRILTDNSRLPLQAFDNIWSDICTVTDDKLDFIFSV